jgi:hypothetical protein
VLRTQEDIDALRRRRDACHAEWQEWYSRATKYRAWYEHLHLEVIENDKGWTGRIWNPVNEVLTHSADCYNGREDAKASLLSMVRLSLVAEFPDRSWPTTEVQWADSTYPASTDLDYFSLRELG